MVDSCLVGLEKTWPLLLTLYLAGGGCSGVEPGSPEVSTKAGFSGNSTEPKVVCLRKCTGGVGPSVVRVWPGGPVQLLCAHRAAVHASLWEAGTQHAAADLHGVEAAAGLLAEQPHGRLLQLPGHRACRRAVRRDAVRLCAHRYHRGPQWGSGRGPL